MDGKKIINKEFLVVELKYGEPIFISDLRKIFDDVEEKNPDYSNISVDFYSYANDGDYDHGDPEAGIYFNGDRLETDDEYEKRLINERKIKELKIKQEEERQKQVKEFEEWERQEFERLKNKYGV
jgi:hypothetical protein